MLGMRTVPNVTGEVVIKREVYALKDRLSEIFSHLIFQCYFVFVLILFKIL